MPRLALGLVIKRLWPTKKIKKCNNECVYIHVHSYLITNKNVRTATYGDKQNMKIKDNIITCPFLKKK